VTVSAVIVKTTAAIPVVTAMGKTMTFECWKQCNKGNSAGT